MKFVKLLQLTTISGLCLISGLSLSQGCISINSEKKPNVILVLVDDLGIGDLGIYGQKILTTPNLDNMASEGIHFQNFYSGSTVCAPSRGVLLTGKHTGHSSVRGNKPQQLIGDDELTIAKVFKEAGYKTGAVGKWGAGRLMPVDDPQRKGFDYFYGYINMFHAHNFFPEFLYENGKKVYLNNKTMRVDGINPYDNDSLREGYGVAEIRNEYTHHLFDEKAHDFIDLNKDNPFFLYIAYNAPHANNEKRPDGMEVDDYYEYEDMDWPIQERGFAAMIRNIDNSMGALLDKLMEHGLEKNTLVMFCSDNGPHHEGGHDEEFFNSNGNYRGCKRDLYEGGIKSPFIAWWPGTIKPNRESVIPFAAWDFLATFSDLTGVDKPADTDGVSFLPTLLGLNQKEIHEYLYWEFNERTGSQAIRKGDWKAVKLNVSKPPEVFELYNLVNDPGETKDVANENPLLVSEFEQLFVSAREEFSVIPLLPEN